jgi:hypothetical protein
MVPVVSASPAAIPEIVELQWTFNELRDLAPPEVKAFDRAIALSDRIVAVGRGPSKPGVRSTTPLFIYNDGIDWTSVDTPPPNLVVETALVVDDAIWMVGHLPPEARSQRQVWTSRDGVTWKRTAGVAGLDFGPGRIYEVVRTGGGWMAWGFALINAESSSPVLLSSVDGKRWEPVALHGAGQFGSTRALAATRDDFLLLEDVEDQAGVSTVVIRSTDAHAWSAVQVTDLKSAHVHDISWTPAGYAVVGSISDGGRGLPAAWFSEDGLTWIQAQVEGPPSGGEDAMWQSIGFAGGWISQGFRADEKGAAWLSVDGRTWTPVTEFPEHSAYIMDIVATADRVVIVGESESGGDPVPVVWVGLTP